MSMDQDEINYKYERCISAMRVYVDHQEITNMARRSKLHQIMQLQEITGKSLKRIARLKFITYVTLVFVLPLMVFIFLDGVNQCLK